MLLSTLCKVHRTFCRLGTMELLYISIFFVQLLVRSNRCEQIYSTEVNGIEFGTVQLSTVRLDRDLKEKIKGHGRIIRHLIPDQYLSGNYIAVIGFGIFTTANLRRVHTIAGSFQYTSYREGQKDEARLGYVTGIITPPADVKHLLFADHSNNCIRGVDRTTNRTYHLIGKCYVRGNVDGNRQDAMIGFPVNLVENPSKRNQIFFYDNDYNSLRTLTYESGSWKVNTVCYWKKKIEALSFDISGEFMYLAYKTGIWRVRTDDWKTENYVIDRHDTGYQDGPLTVAKIGKPFRLLFLDDDLFIFADDTNRNLRVVDLKNSLVSSICLPHSSNNMIAGAIDQCKVPLVRSLIKYDGRSNSTVHVVTHYLIVTLSYTKKVATTQVPVVTMPTRRSGLNTRPLTVNPSGSSPTLSVSRLTINPGDSTATLLVSSTDGRLSSTKHTLNTTKQTSGLARSEGNWLIKNRPTLMYIAGGVIALGIIVAIAVLRQKAKESDTEETPPKVRANLGEATDRTAKTGHKVKSNSKSKERHFSQTRSSSSSKSGNKRGRSQRHKHFRSKG